MSHLAVFAYGPSSASYRLRIGLALKGVSYDAHGINILPGRDEQFLAENRARNPQARVPFVETDAGVLTQSLAILDWLDEAHPNPPFYPADPWQKAHARAFALAIACDIHPLNNLAVLGRLRSQFKADEPAIAEWYMHWIATGFAALETMLAARAETNFAFGDAPTIADICLVPQMANARRYPLDLSAFPRLNALDQRARAHPAFAAAAPNAPKSIA